MTLRSAGCAGTAVESAASAGIVTSDRSPPLHLGCKEVTAPRRHSSTPAACATASRFADRSGLGVTLLPTHRETCRFSPEHGLTGSLSDCAFPVSALSFVEGTVTCRRHLLHSADGVSDEIAEKEPLSLYRWR